MNRYGKYFLAHALWLEDSFCRYYVQEFRHLHREIFDVESVRFFEPENARHWLTRCHYHDPYATISRLRSFLAWEGMVHYQVYLMEDHEVIEAGAWELTRLGNPIVIEPRNGIAVQVDSVAMDSLASIRVEPAPDVDSLIMAFSATLNEIVAEQQKSYDEIEAELAAMSTGKKALTYGKAAGAGALNSILSILPFPGTIVALAKFSNFTSLGNHYIKRSITEKTNPYTLFARDIEHVYREIEDIVDTMASTPEQARQLKAMLQVLFSEPELMGILHDFVKRYYNAIHSLQKTEYAAGGFADFFLAVIIALVTAGAGVVVAVAIKSPRFGRAVNQLKDILNILRRIENRIPLGVSKSNGGGGSGDGKKKRGSDRKQKGMPKPENPKNESMQGERNKVDDSEKREYVGDENSNARSQSDKGEGGQGSGSVIGGVAAPKNSISTGRTTPNSLKEKLAMEQVMSNPKGRILPRMPKMSDTKNNLLAKDGWVKRAQNVNGVETHYVENTKTGQLLDFKFKD